MAGYAEVKVTWDAREWRSCISDYWQIAFLHLQVRKMHRNGKQNVTGTVIIYDQITTPVHLTQQNWIEGHLWHYMSLLYIWSLIKQKYRLRKRKANMASNIHLHQQLMGPALLARGPWWNLGAHAEMKFPHLRFSTSTTGVRRFWSGYMSTAKCKLFAYGLPSSW